MSINTVEEALRFAGKLDPIDAQALLSHVTGRNVAYLIAHPEAPLNEQEQRDFQALIARRAVGEPVAYLTGEREFYGRTFKVSPAVLIPRPETELLVDVALEAIAARAAVRVLDLGTGSGCVAIAIASERPQCKVLALDTSPEALAVARRNALALRIGNVAFLESNLFAALGNERFDVVVSNPPYVAEDDPHLSQGDVRFEPRSALIGGRDGLEVIRTIISTGKNHVSGGGWLLLEHGHDQAAAVRSLFNQHGYSNIFSARDLAGIERVSGGRLTLAVAS